MPLVTYKDLCIDVNDLAVARDFWAPTLGLDVIEFDDDPDDIKLAGRTPQHTIWPCEVPEPHTVKNRVHLDVNAPTLEPFSGLRRLTEPGQFSWSTFADPEGNEFCVFVADEPSSPRLKDVVVDAVDPDAMARWWHDVWGGEIGSRDGYAWIDAIPGAPVDSFDFVPVPEPKTVKNRVHWDVTLTESATVDDLVGVGATVLREPDGDEIRWTVMADPEGNEFCVFAPR